MTILRTAVEDLAALASLALFMSMIMVWAVALGGS